MRMEAIQCLAVVVDGSGNVDGEATQGGTVTSQCGAGCGVVFEITP
jgi:hypothetical protein